MFYKAYFANAPKTIIQEAMRKDGFTPKEITDTPFYIYKAHTHHETKYLVCLEGSMLVTYGKKTCDFRPGDKLIIPGNTRHSAVVGEKGCTFFWSEKIIT